MHSHKPARSEVLQHIKDLFGGKAFQTPVTVGKTFGWSSATSYGHVSNQTFPVRLRIVGGRKLVSIKDYTDFVVGEETKPNRGRPSNKAKAAAAMAMKGGV